MGGNKTMNNKQFLFLVVAWLGITLFFSFIISLMGEEHLILGLCVILIVQGIIGLGLLIVMFIFAFEDIYNWLGDK